MAFPAAHQTSTSLAPLRALEVDITQMGALAEAQLNDAINAFERRDVALAEAVMRGDARIDDAHQEIEKQVVSILGDGPLAPTDLRTTISAMKVAAEVERVGDLAKNTAKRTLVISREPLTSVVAGIARMGRQSLLQFSHVLDAYSARSLSAAKAVWGADDDIDELYNSLFHDTLTAMMRDPAQINACTHLVFISKNYERVGDHATNIAEVLHFLVTGELLVDDRPKGDVTATTAVAPPGEEQAETQPDLGRGDVEGRDVEGDVEDGAGPKNDDEGESSPGVPTGVS